MKFVDPTAGRLWWIGASAILAGLVTQAAPAIYAQEPVHPVRLLIPVYQSRRVWNGVATTPDGGRAFVAFPGADGPGVQAAEIFPDQSVYPYPDAAWNAWKPGADFSAAFVCVNALRVGPDGTSLWIIDAGATGLGKPAVPGAGRIVQVNLKTNQVARVYSLQAALRPDSYVDDIRFHGDLGYVTDAGAPGIIVLDLKTGAVRRLLDGDPTATDRRPMSADGRVLTDEKSKEVRVHADQLEVSPDGKYLYYQPSSGPLARVETRWLDDPAIPPAEVARHAEAWIDTPTTGGTAIDAQGNLYVSDVDTRRVLRITPDKAVSTLVADERLAWCDAMWIDREGFLWMPAAQLNRTPGLNGGKEAVEYPVHIYKLQIGAKPSPLDHP